MKRNNIKRHKLFILTVALPTLLAILYFGIIASDVYVSESQFIIRSPQQQGGFSLGEIFKSAGAGFSPSQDDSYTVQDFILSRDALKGLDQSLHIKQSFSDSGDFLSSFGMMGIDKSNESFFHYYKNKIADVQLDSFSSIATLTTRAFSAEEAYLINQQLLEMSEKLVNQLNERAQQDLIRFANREVTDAAEKAKDAALALANYRNEKGVIDPEKESAIPLQEVGKLQDDLINTKGQIAQFESLAKNNSQLPSLRQHAAMLEREIKKQTAGVAGSGDLSLASKASEFRRLSLEKDFSDKMLASAMSSLETARNEAQRKQQYLETIVQPAKPDKAIQPRRARLILSTFILGLIVWGILTMLIAGIKEHQD